MIGLELERALQVLDGLRLVAEPRLARGESVEDTGLGSAESKGLLEKRSGAGVIIHQVIRFANHHDDVIALGIS